MAVLPRWATRRSLPGEPSAQWWPWESCSCGISFELRGVTRREDARDVSFEEAREVVAEDAVPTSKLDCFGSTSSPCTAAYFCEGLAVDAPQPMVFFSSGRAA